MKKFIQSQTVKSLAMNALIVALAFALEPAMAAGLDKVNSTAQMVQATLAGLSVVSGSVALMYSGYKMMFQSAKWAEIANVVYGSVFVSGSTGISAWLMS